MERLPTGSIPDFSIAAEVSSEARKSIKRLAASGCFDPVTTAAVNIRTSWASSGILAAHPDQLAAVTSTQRQGRLNYRDGPPSRAVFKREGAPILFSGLRMTEHCDA
jgi:hypothetical protein